MTRMKFMILVSIFLYYYSFTLATKPSPCNTSQCTISSISSLVIRYPFRLNNSDQPPYCGHSGFDLHRDSSYKTLIKFPYGGVFAVQNIDYVSQEITLFDPYECLSKKLISLNLRGSPFEIDDEQSQDFWVYNCTGSSFNYSSYEYDNYLSSDLCLSGLDYTVVGTTCCNSSILQKCHKVEKVKILGRILYGYPPSVVISWKSSICRMFHSQVKESTSLDSQSPKHKGIGNSKILKAAILILGAVIFTALLALLCQMIYHHSPSPRTGPDDIHWPRAHYQLDPLIESEDNCQVSEHSGIGYISPKASHGSLLHHYESSPRFPYRPTIEWICVGPRPPHEIDRHQIVEDEDSCQVLESVGLSSSFNRDDHQPNRLTLNRYEPSQTSSYRTAKSSGFDSPSPSPNLSPSPPHLTGQFLEDAEDNCQVLESVALSGRA